jgi:hypothetical protein
LVHPDDLENTKNFFSGKTRNADSTFEHKLVTPEGNLKYIKVIRGEVIYDEAGNFKRISGVIQDITGIRLSEKSARVSRAELIEAQTIAKIGNWKWEVYAGPAVMVRRDQQYLRVQRRQNHSAHIILSACFYSMCTLMISTYL